MTDPFNIFSFFSEILDNPVIEEDGSLLGKVHDLSAYVQENDPPVTGIIISSAHKARFFLSWSHVIAFNHGIIKVKKGSRESLESIESRTGDILLRKGLLDKQIVDTGGAKVVRVNDLHLICRNGSLVLSKVDVGLRGLFRRVGILNMIESFLLWLFDYTLGENLINWRLVQPVGSNDILRLKFSQVRLAKLHPGELADIIEDLDQPGRARVFRALDIEMAADVLEEADPKVQVLLIQDMSTEKASDVLEKMSPSKATDLLQDLEEPQMETLLKEMEPEAAEDVRELLSHDEETAGGMMTTSYFSQPPDATVEEALKILHQEAEDFEVIYYTYILDAEDHLLGVITIRELLISDPLATLQSIMIQRLAVVPPEASKTDMLNMFEKYGLRALPVVDEDGYMCGVIRFKALMEEVGPRIFR